ncbi:hypothetical protein [Glacieibacterium sp.]|uniref:hypothetical protein n=1 Tax=Glacieibacterium sp. TaxID=2860237 RepID=UPI003AFFCCF5
MPQSDSPMAPDTARAAAPGERSNAEHWRWFRRLMAWMFAFSILMVGLAVLYMYSQGVPLRPWFLLFMGGGIALSLMLAAALMGLVFVSARSGIDDRVKDLAPPDVGEER